MKASNTQTQMRKGILEFCVLHIMARGEVYATDLIEELKNSQLIIVEGTLYPLLSRIKNSGLATYKWVESDAGPPRKYYSLTPEGSAFLTALQKTWENLDTSVNQIISTPKNQ